MNYSTFSFSPDYFKSKIIEAGPKWMIRAAVLLSIALLWLFIFSLISPAAGEAWLFNSFVISGVLTAGFVGLVAMLILGISALFASACISYGYKFARNEIAATNSEARQLSGGGQYYVGPDIVVVQSLDETDRVFRARVDDLIDAARPGQWIVELPFQSGYVKIKDESAKGRSIKRGGEGGLLPLWGVTADLPVFNFATETESQYTAYINAFLPTFQAYAEHYRVEVKKEPPFKVGTITTVFLFLLLSLSATAQTNTDKVKTAVSANDFAPTAGQQVHYVFSDGSSATRTADGQKKISELFSAGYIGADNIQRGEVVGIDIDRRPVDIKIKIAATGTDSKPAPLLKTHMESPHNEVVPQKSFTESLPDSATVANGVNQIIQEGDTIKAKLWKSIQPAWILAMWFFDSIFFILIGGGGVFWYYAKTARQNGNLGYTVLKIQRWASRNVLYVCWIITTVVLINTFLHLIYMDWPIWSVMVVWGFILWIALYLTNKVTPNGEEVYFKDGFSEYRQLGGGENQYKKR